MTKQHVVLFWGGKNATPTTPHTPHRAAKSAEARHTNGTFGSNLCQRQSERECLTEPGRGNLAFLR